jgi:hypothetical protein
MTMALIVFNDPSEWKNMDANDPQRAVVFCGQRLRYDDLTRMPRAGRLYQ